VTCTRDDDPDGSLGRGTEFTYGSWGITCTASDTRNNVGTATFNVNVSFEFGIDLVLPKGRAKAHSTIPIDWQYTDLTPGNLGNPVDSSFISPTVSWIGPFDVTDTTCSGPTDDSASGDDSGSSGKRYDDLTMTWQFSWQTPDNPDKRVLLVISPPGAGFDDATECVRLR
jgi:hypothetical protein